MDVLLRRGAVLGASHQQSRWRAAVRRADRANAVAPRRIVLGIELRLERATPLRQPVDAIVIRESDFRHVEQLLQHALIVATG
jgi:hypothetical protein